MELFNFSALMAGASVKACSGVTRRVTRIAHGAGALKMPGITLSGTVKSDSGALLNVGPCLRSTALVDPFFIGAQRHAAASVTHSVPRGACGRALSAGARGLAAVATLLDGRTPSRSGMECSSRVTEKYARLRAIRTADA